MPNSGPNGEWMSTTPEWWARVRYPIVAFAIWYTDGSVYRGTTCAAWAAAPAVGVQVLKVYHAPDAPTKSVVVTSKDEYTLPGQSGSKLGEMIGTEVGDPRFRAITKSAQLDVWEP